MNDIAKDRIRRALQRFGIRVLHSAYYKFPYDASNYSEYRRSDPIVILDVGANIGQSSIWFRRSFPRARIIAFEPFAAIFEVLQRKVERLGVECHRLALSDREEVRAVARVDSAYCQTAQIMPSRVPDGGAKEEIRLERLDSFAEPHGLQEIQILKTDTEGHDLQVLQGAQQLLRSHRIGNIVAEASMKPLDEQHSDLAQMTEFLREYQYHLHSLMDLKHDPRTGRLDYFNALFKKDT